MLVIHLQTSPKKSLKITLLRCEQGLIRNTATKTRGHGFLSQPKWLEQKKECMYVSYNPPYR